MKKTIIALTLLALILIASLSGERASAGSKKVFIPCDHKLEQVLFTPEGTPLVRYRAMREGERAEIYIIDELEIEHYGPPFRALKIFETECGDLRDGRPIPK
jgi:hypothetical protein